ncbi:NMCC_0638 family (lipo)protein [Cupriavidus pinatubonensis]|uniref:NMCC_0638 family (lipo)protein n=1 Tax=Cupriavidus pinatubonensis TaxID=248026 RepID=UPI00403804AA
MPSLRESKRFQKYPRTGGLVKRLTCLTVALVSVLTAATTSFAQSTAEKQSNAATRLFVDACITNGGDEAKTKTWVRDHHLRPFDPAYLPKLLHGKAGEVWSASNQIGDFLVVIETPGQCSVWARRRSVSSANSTYHVVAYTIVKDGADHGMLQEAVTSDSANAEVQVKLKLAWVKIKKERP